MVVAYQRAVEEEVVGFQVFYTQECNTVPGGSVPWRSVPGGSVYNVQMYSLSKVRGGAVPIDLGGGESETLISYNVFLTNFFQF